MYTHLFEHRPTHPLHEQTHAPQAIRSLLLLDGQNTEKHQQQQQEDH